MQRNRNSWEVLVSKLNLGILYPGEMGITIALAAQNTSYDVFWASEGRSPETRGRAQELGLRDTNSLAKLCGYCTNIISVCPPSAAEVISQQVLNQGFKGLYIDANAISPMQAINIGEAMEQAGVQFVDGGIIGGPAWQPGTTRLYLSGRHVERAADIFSAGPLEVCLMGESIGQASALKMCYAAYTKGSTALLCAILATAEALNVREYLTEEWSHSIPSLVEGAPRRVSRVTAKAWRFSGEMEEIASTFSAVGIPAGFHSAAAEIYQRLAGYQGAETPELEQVLASLLKPG
jgi:3-hydroxyisobutyrate dehydrogenase-like beta-hydroxyacid dehydrogenase